MTNRGEFRASFIVNCGGLHSDRLARQNGCDPEAQIVPFRGEYFSVVPERRHLVKNLIYPVPNPAFPFLGVHFTRMIDGTVHAGPNAVLAFAREGYAKSNFSWNDFSETLLFPRLSKTRTETLGRGLEGNGAIVQQAGFRSLIAKVDSRNFRAGHCSLCGRYSGSGAAQRWGTRR